MKKPVVTADQESSQNALLGMQSKERGLQHRSVYGNTRGCEDCSDAALRRNSSIWTDSSFFITATDTDAGKTYVTALLTRVLRKAGLKTVAIKPLACGSMNDSTTLQAAADHELSLEEITPVFYEAPLVPLDAAPLEGKIFSLGQVLPTIQKLQKNYSSLLIEGVAGWLHPLSPTEILPDLAHAIGFPIILVIRNRLGAMNHTLLTLESIAHRGFHCAGMILNHHPEDQEDPAIPGNRRFFQNLAQQQKHNFFLEVEPNQQELSLFSSASSL